MSDLIDRQKAKDYIESQKGRPFIGCTIGEAMKIMLDEVPSEEPERKTGRWSNYKDEHCCSVCKCVVISYCWDDEIRYDYCIGVSLGDAAALQILEHIGVFLAEVER